MESHINLIFDKFIELRGDRVLADDKSLIGGLGWIGEKRVVLIAYRLEKLAETGGILKPEAYRKGFRLIQVAEHLQKPIVVLLAPFDRKNYAEQLDYVSQNASFENVQKALYASVPILSISFAAQNHWGVIGDGIFDMNLRVKLPIEASSVKRRVVSALSKLGRIPSEELIRKRRRL